MVTWGIPQPPQFLEFEEVRAIIDWVNQNSNHVKRDTLLLETLWESGARISEILGLVPEGIGTKSLIIRNLKQRKKTAKAEKNGAPLPHKEVIVSPELCSKLREFAKDIPEGTPVFRGNWSQKKQLNYRYVHRLVTKAADELNIVKAKKRKNESYGFVPAWPHLFRHASAMRILDETGDLKLVQRQLGHASIITTEMYATVRPEKAGKDLSEVRWKEND